MSFLFHPQAEFEFNESIDRYEAIETGLGHDFATEVYEAIQRAVALPQAWMKIDDDIRRSLVKRFPYGVLYSIEDNAIYIVAVMHFHRHPDYWKHRVS
ncbi:MAG: type II toxin-antitoxin system RelE/ParE family toxin [Psychrosphaera sp.]|nr:type II toxin-antitoxin system RelE/ParE family toxin [Psychrosphaera sp.]